MKFLFSVLLVFYSYWLSADPGFNRRLDSLLTVANNAGPRDADSAFMEVGRLLAYQNPVDAIPYLKNAIQLAENNENFKVLCMAYSFSGIAYSRIGLYNKALEYYNLQLNTAKHHGISDEEAWANNHISLVMLNLKNYELANNYLTDALQIADSLHDDYLSQFIYSKIGQLMQETGRYYLAVDYLEKVLEYRQRPPVDSTILSATYRELGHVYFAMERYPEAKYYYGISRSMVDSTISDMSAAIDVNMARIYRKEFQIDSALICVHSAISTASRFGDIPVLKDAFGVLGSLYYSFGKYSDAERCYLNQTKYQDSVNYAAVLTDIYKLQFQKELREQKRDIDHVSSQNRDYQIMAVVVFALVALLIFYALRLRRKRLTILNMNRQILNSNVQQNMSINYAKKIQKAVFPNFDLIAPMIPHKFMFFRPKDEVSGNFFWNHTSGKYEMLALCDCGESGVPGAFMSMLGTSLLHEVADAGTDPATILSMVRDRVFSVMRRLKRTSDAAFGVDISLLVSDTSCNKVYYSGVKFPLLIIRRGRQILVQEHSDNEVFYNIEFQTSEVELEENDRLFMMTHGFCSQKNEAGEEMGRQRLYDFINDVYPKPMEMHKALLSNFFDSWRGNRPQERDLLIMGGVFNNNGLA